MSVFQTWRRKWWNFVLTISHTGGKHSKVRNRNRQDNQLISVKLHLHPHDIR